MKTSILVTLFVFAFTGLRAQIHHTRSGINDTPYSFFNTVDSVDINNINAAVLVCGDLWHQSDSPFRAACFFPNGSQRTLQLDGALWVSGYDDAGNLHIAAQTYRQDGNGYWPGPLDASDTITYATSQNWAKIWKVNRSDIQYFQALGSHTIANTPVAILTWPANGNVYAQGNGGVPLTINEDMAPFVDLNGDGIYEPLQGEYPDVPGDQALWWVFSDNGPQPSQARGTPLDIEVHAMAYAYGMRGTLIDNVIYYNYKIINRSANNYSNARVAFWDSYKLGSSPTYDNFIGFDSTWRLGIIYDGTNCDGCNAGNPPDAYGLNPPVCGVTLVHTVGDSGANYMPAGSFDYYNDDYSVVGNPSVDTEYDNYMRSKLRDGAHFTDDYMGPGIPSVCYGTGPNTNYVYTGDPGNDSSWSECTCNDNPGDRRTILSTRDFYMAAGGTYDFTFALITTDTGSGGGGCPDVSFDSIKVVADTAWAIYQNPLPPIPAGISNINVPGDVTIYPNPASDILYIKTAPTATAGYYEIHDIVGDLIQQGNLATGTNSVDINLLPAGVYILTTSTGNGQRVVRKFVKL